MAILKLLEDKSVVILIKIMVNILIMSSGVST